MKNSKKSVFLRYEFSDETGKPEGGDIFEFKSTSEVLEMAEKIVKVAQADQVAVNLTIGQEKTFFGFLQNVGISYEDAETEMVDRDVAPIGKTQGTKKKASGKKGSAKKSSKKSAK